jgi:hypothetical protein
MSYVLLETWVILICYCCVQELELCHILKSFNNSYIIILRKRRNGDNVKIVND